MCDPKLSYPLPGRGVPPAGLGQMRGSPPAHMGEISGVPPAGLGQIRWIAPCSSGAYFGPKSVIQLEF